MNFNACLFLSTLLCGLLAGLFYGYDCSVNAGLGNLSNHTYLSAFQSINSAIQNPYFFISFMGSGVFLLITTWLSYTKSPASFYFLLVASIFFIVGVWGITVFGNIPLNNDLAQFDLKTASETTIAEKRKLFENSWNLYHRIRTMAAICSFSLIIISILKK